MVRARGTHIEDARGLMLARAISYALASSLALIACSGTNAQPTPATTTVAPDGGSPDGAALENAGETEACAAQRVALQAKLDRAHAATTGAVLAVKTPDCGLRVLTSAPEKLALTGGKLHRVGSITKTYVAAVVLGLVHEGKLALEDTLAKHLPSTGIVNAETITVRQLLNHTSGIANYTDTAAFGKLTGSVAPEELVAIAAKEPPDFAPGKGWHYSNTNYVLLGLIAQGVTGAKIGALVRTRVLDKVGLSETFFDGEEPVGGEIATGLSSTGQDLTKKFDLSLAWAAGAIAASPRDVATWVEALGSGAFHDPDTQKALLTPVKTDVSSLDYGLGVFLYHASITGGLGPGIGHGGDIPGYHSEAVYLPEKKTTIVGIVDSDRDVANEVLVAAIDVLTATPE